MLTNKTLSLLGAAVSLLMAPMAHAFTYSDTGAAIVVWPKIVVDDGRDTVLQLTNQAPQPTAAHCFYVNANNRCTNTGEVCENSLDCQDDTGFFGSCQAGWIEINFDIILTSNQPLGWSAEAGLGQSDLPCKGGFGNRCTQGIGTNAGTGIPPVGETPFVGELKCIQVDPITRLPFECTGNGCRDDLEGAATITKVELGIIDTRKYNAVGLRSNGFNNGDAELVIGGEDEPEYQPCAQVLVFNHLFDNAVDPISGIYRAQSELSLVPCTEDFLQQQVPRVTAQFLVYNEFEQRFSTSQPVDCLLDRPISRIDTTQPARSIFNAGVSGTVAGQTRITGVNGGLIGAASLSFCDVTGCDATGLVDSGAAYNLNQFADRDHPDFIRIP
ncbi:MAG: hypothetical protein ACRDUB_00050 [Mycobacterium sp.]